MPEYEIHDMVYTIRSPNIWATLTYITYDKVLEKLKEYEHLSPMDGSDGEIIIEYHRNCKLIKGFNEDTQKVDQ